jgi:hypothetical protein
VAVNLETANFGSIDVTVGDLVLMCERAKKTHLYTITVTPVDEP